MGTVRFLAAIGVAFGLGAPAWAQFHEETPMIRDMYSAYEPCSAIIVESREAAEQALIACPAALDNIEGVQRSYPSPKTDELNSLHVFRAGAFERISGAYLLLDDNRHTQRACAALEEGWRERSEIFFLALPFEYTGYWQLAARAYRRPLIACREAWGTPQNAPPLPGE